MEKSNKLISVEKNLNTLEKLVIELDLCFSGLSNSLKQQV